MSKTHNEIQGKFKNNSISLKVALLTSLGSGLEYYDFVIYGMMAKYLSDIFFSMHDSLSGIIQTFIVFAVGYLIRPFGGTIIGMIADTYGRKKTFGLLLCRLCQGISLGAELPGATTIISEYAPANKLGRLCSVMLSSISIGALMATAMVAILNKLYSYKEIIEWVWRVPFIIGGVLAIISYYIRKNISETPEFLQEENSRNKKTNTNLLLPLKLLLSQNLPTIAIGFGLVFFHANLVIINLYFPVYINKYFNYELADIYSSMTVSMVTSFIFTIIFGWLSDYISKLKILLFSLIFFSIFLFLSFTLLNYKTFWSLQIFFIIYQLFISLFFTSYMPILSRLFATKMRYTATALIYNSAYSVASFIPIIASYLLEKYQSPLILGIFFMVSITLALISVTAIMIQNKKIIYY
ncbi:MFS transporter [Rickettsia endosymbiont of Orchestes rusci]|uniref:MFS transporter n=1 Tax=Rickettsia endosymbiont of Orchestes rusci TaxID=3066250 RepID=UPI00313D4028